MNRMIRIFRFTPRRAAMVCAALFAGSAMTLPPRRVGAQEAETARIRAERALPADVYRELVGLADEAVLSGVPGDPIFNKALEGVAKGVPAGRLLPAVRTYVGRLGEASGAFGPGAPAALIVAGADALQRGVARETLGAMAEHEERSAMAVLVLADLVEEGVPTDRALGVLREAMDQRAGEERMLDIPARVRRLVREGHSARDAAERVRQAMERTRRGGGFTAPVPPGSEPVTRDRTGDTSRRRGGGQRLS